jgi:hypothetical protein
MVRTLSTPQPRNASHITSNSWLPTFCSRTPGSTPRAMIQPQGGDPNSQARTSPTMKPSSRPSSSATRKKRLGRAP